MTTHTGSRGTSDPLAVARERWGLDQFPPDVKPEVKRRGKAIATAAGTPADVARAQMQKPVPEEWVREVRAFSPKTEAHSWLYLTWREPLFQADRGRWCLYQCIPEPLIGTEMRALLSGAPYWELPQDQRAGRAAVVSAFRWLMYREFRVDARPLWVIQGNDGGTPMSYSEIERRWLRAMHQPDTPPALGALPFAPFDQRVIRAVQRRDKLAQYGGSIARLRASSTTEAVRIAAEAEERAYRKEFFRWFSDKMHEQADVWNWYINHTEVTHRLRKETREEFLAAAELEDRFIETGRVPDPIEYRLR